MKRIKIFVNGQTIRPLFEFDDDLKNLYRLADSTYIENIELAIQIGIGQGIDIKGYLKEKYQTLIDFVNIVNTNKVQGKSLIGRIAYLLNLTELNIKFKDLKSIPIDLSLLVNLQILCCYGNQFQNLDVSNNKELKVLNCLKNKLQKLDVCNNNNLQLLNCSDNQLQFLDVNNNKKLQYLICDNNKLQFLDVNNNKELQYLICDNNKLQFLDVNNNKKLKELYCYSNNFQNLYVSNNGKLKKEKISKDSHTEIIWV